MAEAATVQFRVTGMTCQGCARAATQAIQSVPGVAGASVDLAGNCATVRWAPGTAPNPQAVVDALQRGAGFPASVLAADQPKPAEPKWSPLAGWRFNLVVGLTVTVPLLLGEWVFGWGLERWFQWLCFAAVLPVQVLCGARFYRGAWLQLRAGSANMDTLVALGSTTAFLYSTVALLAGWPGHLYFVEAAAILTLISLGHWLEARASARAASALEALLDLAPPTARRLDSGGTDTTVPAAELKVGDRVLLKPGDRVPTDGEVLEGQSAVDEAMLTGESMPVEKASGARLYAGTVNQSGRLVLRVTATGEATALRQIMAAVERAQNSRANIQRLVDRVSGVFVPIVVLVAMATALWWGLAFDRAQAVHHGLSGWLWHATLPTSPWAAAAIHAAAVLIVACPCAMGLATPIAIMVGANVAARRGILIRDGQALEKSGRLTGVVFDKTGTLTRGQVEVAAVEEIQGGNRADGVLARLAGTLARPSNHPLSLAVVQWARAQGREPSSAPLPSPSDPRWRDAKPTNAADVRRSQPFGSAGKGPDEVSGAWTELRGQGVQARLEGRLVRLGSLAWLRECGVRLDGLSKFADNWTDKGATVIGLGAEHDLLGLFALRDSLKPHAWDVVQRLTAQGQRVYLVTGDHTRTAAAVAQAAGIAAANVLADAKPERKADFIAARQQAGERLAFVGDGINDAPALEQADLGIAVSRASDVAREAADLVLLRSDIEAIPEAIGLAQATLRTIKQNLFWAFFYNAAAVPLAALGFLSPIVCAAAMGASDLLVIGNALRLRRWRQCITTSQVPRPGR
ncbi:MAG: cation-translocating P-type ATPase [Verrucomicrobiales bacterium]|nr:cation-translocating P-type ATPase [Verrucomicrobiales bacterium]